MMLPVHPLAPEVALEMPGMTLKYVDMDEDSVVVTSEIMLDQWFWVRGMTMLRPTAVQPLATLVCETLGQAAEPVLQG